MTSTATARNRTRSGLRRPHRVQQQEAAEKKKATKKANGSAGKTIKPVAKPDQSEKSKRLDSKNEIDHDAAVAKVIKQHDNQLPQHAVEMVRARNRNDFQIAGVLCELRQKAKDDKGCLGAEFAGEDDPFAAWAEARLRFRRSKANTFAQIYGRFREAGYGPDEWEIIGWAKAAKVAQVEADKLRENKGDILDKARKLNEADFKEHITTTYVDARTDTEKTKKTTFRFAVFNDDTETVRRAIDHAADQIKQQLPQGDRESEKAFEARQAAAALVGVCGDYLNFVADVEREPVADVLRRLVARHDVEAVGAALEQIEEQAAAGESKRSDSEATE